jgi:DNA-binding FadR family transcriptional regulator
MMNFLHFHSLSIAEITMIRFMLEPNIARLVAAKINEEDLITLQSFISSEEFDPQNNKTKDIGFHRYLARITNNSMLILIVDFIESHLDEIKQSLDLPAEFYTRVRQAHRRIVSCLAEQDPDGVSEAMTEDVLEVGHYLAERMGEKPFEPADFNLIHS